MKNSLNFSISQIADNRGGVSKSFQFNKNPNSSISAILLNRSFHIQSVKKPKFEEVPYNSNFKE